MNLFEFLMSDVGQEVISRLRQDKPAKQSNLPRYIKITESGDYNNVVRVLDTNIFRNPSKSPKPTQRKAMTKIDENYDKLIKEFNLSE